MEKMYKIIAAGFGSGYSPIAPGTAGALLAALIWWGLVWLLQQELAWSFEDMQWLLFGLCVSSVVIGVKASGLAEKSWGKDPSRVVVDEMAGMWISLLWLPFSPFLLLLAFLLFRIFDIWKPFYIRRAEDLKGGWGIMMDDVLAGIYTNLILQIGLYFC